jgi:hypothetical protein
VFFLDFYLYRTNQEFGKVSVVEGVELKRRSRRKRKTNNAKPPSNPTCSASKTRSS